MNEPAVERLNPVQALELMKRRPSALLVDVRSKVEFDYVGHPTDAVHIPWQEFPDWEVNGSFSEEVRTALKARGVEDIESTPLLMICRSGARSYAAAELLARDGFKKVYNVEEGFEGDKDEHNHRGQRGGWRYHGLPWEQT